MNRKETKAQNHHINYELKLESTEASAGYFMCIPKDINKIEDVISSLEKSPFDDFMRRYALRLLAQTPEEELIKLSESDDPMLTSLLYETALTQSFLPNLKKKLEWVNHREAASLSPLVYLRCHELQERKLHNEWVTHFSRNLESHIPLPPPADIGLSFPMNEKTLSEAEKRFEDIGKISWELKKRNEGTGKRMAPGETASIAREKLEKAGIFADVEMRHESSLSPIALLRKWRIHINVDNGRNSHTFSGIQTSYGKGLSLDTARASLFMEVVERYSSFANIDRQGVLGYTNRYPLVKATRTELLNQGEKVLSPNDLGLETPYRDEPLNWIRGEAPTPDGGKESVLVPVQTVFLFCNMDEVSLFSSMSSTGLASGNTPEGAKVSALLEAVERHTEATVPYNPAMCFELVSSDPMLAPLLSAYRSMGISVRFQDLTTEMGIPCCKAFVTGPDNVIHKGTSAHLDAKRAIVSALTEVPWPFPNTSPTKAGLSGIPFVDFEALPDYATGNDKLDLQLIERLLGSAGFTPIYIDLTREDINLPVVKAIIPGFQLSADMDAYSRVSPALFRNYLNLHKAG